MSFRPESMPGWTDGLTCPYCGSDDIDYTGDTHTEFGASDSYEITEGTCNECGKKLDIVERVVCEVEGCYKHTNKKSKKTKETKV